MNNQEKKDWLNRYKSICRQIMSKGEEIERLRSLETKITPTLSDMPKAQSSDNKIEAITEKIIEVENQIGDELDELKTVRAEIENAVKQIPNETYHEVINRRYIQGQSWERIALEMNYEYHYVARIHGAALNALHIERR